jgi:hypothetical protein
MTRLVAGRRRRRSGSPVSSTRQLSVTPQGQPRRRVRRTGRPGPSVRDHSLIEVTSSPVERHPRPDEEVVERDPPGPVRLYLDHRCVREQRRGGVRGGDARRCCPRGARLRIWTDRPRPRLRRVPRRSVAPVVGGDVGHHRVAPMQPSALLADC